MPDLLSIGLGGGSLVDTDAGTAGPRSVGHRITSDALSFGGDRLTATDIGVAACLPDLGDGKRLAHLDRLMVERVLGWIHRTIETSVDRMKVEAAPVPLV